MICENNHAKKFAMGRKSDYLNKIMMETSSRSLNQFRNPSTIYMRMFIYVTSFDTANCLVYLIFEKA